MGCDTKGRWVPDGDAIDWQQDRQALRMDLTERGLDWRHEGKYAFRTDAWGQMSESQRLDTLQAYDSWYDQGGQLSLDDESWGLDIERGLTYNQNWDAQFAFNQLTGGKGSLEVTSKTRSELQNPREYKDIVRHTILGSHIAEDPETGEDKAYITLSKREWPMDWKYYSNDDLYRAAIDEVLEDFPDLFMGPGDDYNNATQVRAATREIQSWRQEVYDEALATGKDASWVRNEINRVFNKQIDQGKATNKPYEKGNKTLGFEYNQQVQIRKYKTWDKFDPETGKKTKVHPLTGEIRSTHEYKQVSEPTRMTITGNKLMENIDEGVFYSDSVGREEEITASLADEPDKIGRPSLTIRKVEPKEPTVGQESAWGGPEGYTKFTGEKWRTKGEVVL
mgnify:CR=1 FL=1